MKIRWAAAAAALLTLSTGCACAQTLPGTDCFSPGLAAVRDAVGAGEGLRVTASSVKVSDALYARDLSVLSAMLEGTQFLCESGPDKDALTIVRGGETLLSGALVQEEDAAVVKLNGEAFRVEDRREALSALLGTALPEVSLPEALRHAPVPSLLERLPLADAADWLETLTQDTLLPGGFRVTQDFALERTLSDDGTRVTRLTLSGAVAREGEEAWQVSGKMQQTNGNPPKTTAEVTIARDKDNTFTLTYSSTRKNTVTRKDKAGQAQVDTVLKSVGRLAGHSVTTQLKLRLTNDWTADAEKLAEKISISAELGHTDKTPGRRMQRLNDLNIKLRNAIRITTLAAGGPLELSDSVTLDFKMDGNAVAAGSAQLLAVVGDDAASAVEDAQDIRGGVQELSEAAQQAIVLLAQRVVGQLGEADRNRITNGL